MAQLRQRARKDKGTEFTVTFPVLRTAYAEEEIDSNLSGVIPDVEEIVEADAVEK